MTQCIAKVHQQQPPVPAGNPDRDSGAKPMVATPRCFPWVNGGQSNSSGRGCAVVKPGEVGGMCLDAARRAQRPIDLRYHAIPPAGQGTCSIPRHNHLRVPGRGTIEPSVINGAVAFCASKSWETHESGMSGTCHAQLFLTWCIGATPSESQTKGLDDLICKTIAREWPDPEVVKAVLSHKERIKSGARESSRLPLRSASLKLFNRTFATGWPFLIFFGSPMQSQQ